MASLTRSASLTDIIRKKDGNASSRPASGTNNDGRFSYGSPQKKISSNFDARGTRSSSLFFPPQQNRGSVTPLRGGSSAVNSSLGNWQWLSNSKSFHDLQLLNQVLPSNSESAQTPGTETRRSSRRKRAERNTVERYLDHLETLLPRYCMHLSHPTYKEAANAMSLLLGTPPPIPAVPVLPGGNNQKNSAYALPGSPEKEQQNKAKEVKKNVDMKSLLSSPFRSRKPKLKKPQAEGNQKSQRWGSRYPSSVTSSASSSLSKHGSSSERNNKPVVVVTNKLDEAAWQEFVSPLVLLAGAEAIYADLEHVHPSPSMIQWGGLYQRVASGLLDMLPPDEKNASKEEEKANDATEEGTDISPSPRSPPSSPRFLAAPNLFPADVVRAAIANTVPTTPTRTNATMGNGNSPADKVARVKYKGLRSLSQWLDFKRQWLPFHESLYLTWSPDNLVFLGTFAAALPNETNIDDNISICGNLLMESLQQEIQTTLALMEMAFSLERSGFLETIVSAQRVKKQLLRISQKETALVLWMRTTFQDYLSIMPLMFDRIHTFATPLYGFDQQLLLDATKKERTFLDDKKGVVDLDIAVLDFLRRHEKAGGADMAVSIVMDTSGIADDEDENRSPPQHSHVSSDRTVRRKHPLQRVELGFAIHKEPKPSLPETPARRSRSNSLSKRYKEAHTQSPSTERRESSSDITKPNQWPAIYLRSTTRQARTMSSVTGATLGLISGMRGSTSNMDASSGSQSALHPSNSRTSWSSEKMSPRAKRKPARSILSPGNVFEYEAESTQPSWPHSEWGQLEGLLESMNTETVTATVVMDSPINSPHPSDRRKSDANSKTGKIFEQSAAISFHPDGVGPAIENEAGGRKSGAQALFESGGSLFSVDLPKQLWVSSNNHAPTTFHAVRLSKFKWMIVMVKGEEESRWHRRKARGLSDEEIRSFLDDMASKLRVSNRFLELKTCQTARVKVRDPLAPRVRGRDLGLRDAEWQSEVLEDNDELQDEVLELMKEAFNISANSPMLNRAESILTTMSGFRGGTAGSRSPRERRRILASQRNTGPYAESSDYREGAAWFFLGPALYRQFLESTNE